MSNQTFSNIELLKKLMPTAAEQQEEKRQFDLIRQYNYDKFPLALNLKYQSMYNCKFENSWSQLYDQLAHLHELYHIQWQSEVRYIHLFNQYSILIFDVY